MKNINPTRPPYLVKEKVKLIQDICIDKEFKLDKSGVMGFLNSLNPLQLASETIAQLAHYKYQMKILETEQKRIDHEASIIHHQIDAALKAGLQVLVERREALHLSLKIISKDLDHASLEKKRVIDCIDNLIANISNPTLTSEEKQLSHAAMSILTDSLKIMGEQCTVKLEMIVQSTQKTLEALPSSDFLLTFREE